MSSLFFWAEFNELWRIEILGANGRQRGAGRPFGLVGGGHMARGSFTCLWLVTRGDQWSRTYFYLCEISA